MFFLNRRKSILKDNRDLFKGRFLIGPERDRRVTPDFVVSRVKSILRSDSLLYLASLFGISGLMQT